MDTGNPNDPPILAQGIPEQPVITSEPLTVRLDLAAPRVGLESTGTVDDTTSTLRLDVEGVLPPMENLDVGVRIFLNLPEADVSTSVEDPHYVSSFTFFEHVPDEGGGHHHEGHEGHEQGGPSTFSVNLRPAIQRLEESGLYSRGEPLHVTMVSVPIHAPDETEDFLETTGGATDVEIPFERLSLTRID